MIVEETIRQSKPEVLIMSAQKDISSFITNILNNSLFSINLQTTHCTDLDILAGKHYDLIIICHNSEVNSLNILQNIRMLLTYRQVPVIIISEQSEEMFLQLTNHDLAPCDIIFKPVQASVLLTKINIFLKAYFTELKLRFVDNELKQIKKELKDQNKQLKHLALHDALTSTPNRYFFERTAVQILKIAKRYKRSFAALLIDIDNFKWINDKFGHNIGDEVIKTVANKLKSSIRESDIVSRLGGDEFAVILSEIKNSMSASLVAQKMLKEFEQPLRIKQKSIKISLSIGITIYNPAKDKDYETLMEEADIAMYKAKNNGKNCFEYFSESLKESYNYQNTLNYELQSSLKKNEFYLNYQPIIDISTNRIIGVESLIRWKNPKLGIVPPLDFIPVAEQTGLIHEIGNWVLESSCSQLAFWKNIGYRDLFISVNISAKQLKNIRFGEELKFITEKYGIKQESIELEITESAFTTDLEKYIKFLHSFKNRLSIDDFGAQYSSLSRLGKIPLITIKIDGSLLQGIKNSPKSKIILRHLFNLAEELSLKVIVEHVETQEEVDFLKSNKCSYAQGYYYCKPLTAEKMTEFLAKDKTTFDTLKEFSLETV